MGELRPSQAKQEDFHAGGRRLASSGPQFPPTSPANQPRPGFPFLHRTALGQEAVRTAQKATHRRQPNAAATAAAGGGRRNEPSPGRPGSSAGSASAKLPSRRSPLLPPPPPPGAAAAAAPGVAVFPRLLVLPPPAPSVSAGARGGIARALPPPSVHVLEKLLHTRLPSQG